ncbi:methylmalonyl-CoA mutase small subunit [Phaeovibrio sulfidiphilus]|uniref:Methylmalonyl-CoA mutase small subunit n=1 Tax=Phaeovibrio sulfidiphilus TaxID=1220600 RepID=A0A8J7CC97_9PROT|nr:methylmalonyl-CoA mutase family protein [Phaeovibrio sulfidiphilus]MBE1237038.1 methylmalonyl-CoA mutase small subunit [Phaeovibrio sulfidiphilus]
MTQDNLPLGAEFPTPDLEDWKTLVEKSLNGAPFDKKMLTKTFEGFSLHPLYTRADEAALPVSEGLPGFAPFLRGASAEGASVGGWEICQEINHPDPKEAARQALSELEGGATALLLSLDWITQSGLNQACFGEGTGLAFDGVFVQTLADLRTALEGVHLDAAPVYLNAGHSFEAAGLALTALWEEKGIAPEQARGGLNADPIADYAYGGTVIVTPERALARLGQLAAHMAARWPNATTAQVDGAVYHSAGSSESQMMGAMLSTGVAYLRAMEAAGLDATRAARQITFSIPMDADQFLGIAKLRTFRRLWGRVLEACGVPENERVIRIAAKTAQRMLTERDPWVNMLRTTVSTFASVVGGADSITITPFDAAAGLSTEFARRIARNVQILLKDESNLGRVIDPAGGSWAVESLSEQLAQTSWDAFQSIEREGGIVRALEGDAFLSSIRKTCSERQSAIASRRIPVTGVSEFPNLREAKVETLQPDWDTLEEEALGRMSAAARTTRELLDALDGKTSPTDDVLKAVRAGAPFLPVTNRLTDSNQEDIRDGLDVVRLAEGFEALRDNADAWKDEHGSYPSIFLVTLGPVAEHTARATFAQNLFEAGGIEALPGGVLETADDAVAAWKKTGARAAVLCGSDERYEALAADVARALKQAGLPRLYLAGKPDTALQDAGVDAFVHMGCPVFDVLEELQMCLGVYPADDQDEGEE